MAWLERQVVSPNGQNSDRGIETTRSYHQTSRLKLRPNGQNSDRGIETTQSTLALNMPGDVPMDRIPTEELKRCSPFTLEAEPYRPNGQNSDRGIETSPNATTRQPTRRPNGQNSDRGIETLTSIVHGHQTIIVPMDRIPTEELKRSRRGGRGDGRRGPNGQNSDREIETFISVSAPSLLDKVPMDRIPTEELKPNTLLRIASNCHRPNGQNSDRGIETGKWAPGKGGDGFPDAPPLTEYAILPMLVKHRHDRIVI